MISAVDGGFVGGDDDVRGDRLRVDDVQDPAYLAREMLDEAEVFAW